MLCCTIDDMLCSDINILIYCPDFFLQTDPEKPFHHSGTVPARFSAAAGWCSSVHVRLRSCFSNAIRGKEQPCKF